MTSRTESDPLTRLHRQLRERPMRQDLEPVRKRAHEMIQPHRPEVVQVVGSNGKGSVVHYLSELLIRENQTLVTYTSPHLHDVTERIAINGETLTEDELRNLLGSFDGDPLEEFTPFESLFLCALQQAVNQRADYLILEAGMGGRWDATSALDPEWVILTSLDLEHTQHLGSTKQTILREQLAQIPREGALLTGPIDDTESRNALQQLLRSKQLTRVGLESEAPVDRVNRRLALIGARLLTDTPAGPLNEQLASLKSPPGRQEVRTLRDRRVLYDVAHTPRAVNALLETLRRDFPETDRHLLYGSLEGKQTEAILRKLDEAFSSERTLFTRPDSPRARDPQSLQQTWPEHDAHPRVEDKPGEAFRGLLNESNPGDVICVAGSFHLVGTIRNEWHD